MTEWLLLLGSTERILITIIHAVLGYVYNYLKRFGLFGLIWLSKDKLPYIDTLTRLDSSSIKNIFKLESAADN